MPPCFSIDAAVEGLTQELIGVIGPTGSDAIKQMLDAAGSAEPKGWAGLIGIAVLIFAAAGFVGALQDALDRIWEAPEQTGGIWSFIKTKLFSFSLVLAASFFAARIACFINSHDGLCRHFRKRPRIAFWTWRRLSESAISCCPF